MTTCQGRDRLTRLAALLSKTTTRSLRMAIVMEYRVTIEALSEAGTVVEKVEILQDLETVVADVEQAVDEIEEAHNNPEG